MEQRAQFRICISHHASPAVVITDDTGLARSWQTQKKGACSQLDQTSQPLADDIIELHSSREQDTQF